MWLVWKASASPSAASLQNSLPFVTVLEMGMLLVLAFERRQQLDSTCLLCLFLSSISMA